MKTSAETGRFVVRDLKTDRKWTVEPLENRQEKKVELQKSETVVEDNKKYKGTIHPSESIITEENGYKNIVEVSNPLDYIERVRNEGNAGTEN